MLSAKENFKSVISLVIRALERDGETKPTRAEMAKELKEATNKLLEELEK